MSANEFSNTGRCVYCTNVKSPLTDDHIFPNFLGGRATVPACRTCNSIFGHTFEAEVSRQLLPFHVFISGIGIPLRSADPTWKEALEDKGKKYDLHVTDSGVQACLTHPIIQRNEQGRIVAGEFRTAAEARRFADSLIAKGKAVEIEFVEEPAADLGPQQYVASYTIGSALRRLALKMCVAAYMLLPEKPIYEEVSEARIYLTGSHKAETQVNSVYTAISDYVTLDALRRGLSHVIYVERSAGRVYGVVQFFGFLQLYCRLGTARATKPAAVLCTLDPVLGEEVMRRADPLSLDEPPYSIPREEYTAAMMRWQEKQRREIIARGGKAPDFGPLKLTIE